MEHSDAMWLTFQPYKLHTQYTVNEFEWHTRVHRILTGPANWLCATLKWLPEARHAETRPWTHALFSCQKLLEILVSVTYCVVPRQKCTKLWGLTLSLSDFLLLLCGRILPDCFRAPVENHCKGPEHRTTIFSAILRGHSTESMTPVI